MHHGQKQPITKETFCLFLNTSTLLIELMAQIGLHIFVSSKHTRNSCEVGNFSKNIFLRT